MPAISFKLRPRFGGTLSGAKPWAITLAATVASTYALDAFATAVGVLLVTSQFLAGLDRVSLVAFLAGTYLIWAAGIRVNLRANWHLLATTRMSTNVLSKAGFDLFLTGSARSRKIAASAGYVITELVKEIPYYSGAFGIALVSESPAVRTGIFPPCIRQNLLEVCESPQTSLVRLALIGFAMALSLGTTETTETQKAISDIVTLQG